MKNVAITLEWIITDTSDIKQINSPGYWPFKDSICVNIHHPLHAQSLGLCVFEGQPFLNSYITDTHAGSCTSFFHENLA